MNPIFDEIELKKRYNITQCIIDNNYKRLEDTLCKIKDIEKYHRLLSLNRIKPYCFAALYYSYKEIIKLFDILDEYPLLKNLSQNDLNKELISFVKDIEKIFNFEIMSRYIETNKNAHISFYLPGVNTKIETMKKSVIVAKEKLGEYTSIISKMIMEADNTKKDLKNGYAQLERKTSDYIIKITNKRLERLGAVESKGDKNKLIKKGLKKIESVIGKITDKKELKTSMQLCSKEMKLLSKEIFEFESKMKSIISTEFKNYTIDLYSNHKEMMNYIVSFVSQIDVMKSFAKNSINFNYSKPSIVKSDDSFLCASNIRHPIIERIHEDIEYTPNDISLGHKPNKIDIELSSIFENNRGMFIYGSNASGKSTYMTSIGLSLLLAQIGHYVPCKKMIYYPYRRLMTRIAGTDDIHRKLSSYGVEMSETRIITNTCKDHSLVLGDEVCRGTENISAISIVGALTKYLLKNKTQFIFTTHLHELTNLDIIKQCENLGFYHMKTQCNGNEVIYDRKIIKGSGDTLYGVEVAKYMGINDEIIQDAYDVRKKLLNQPDEIISTKKSKYNSKVYIDLCGICNEKAVDTHHINEQHKADINNHIDHFHKNRKHNLIPLCKKCHNDVHHNKIFIEGWKQTSNGIKLLWHSIEQKNKNKIDSTIKRKIKSRFNYYKKKNNNLLFIKDRVYAYAHKNKIDKSLVDKILNW
jgi:DNA mismatch repair protein MutS